MKRAQYLPLVESFIPIRPAITYYSYRFSKDQIYMKQFLMSSLFYSEVPPIFRGDEVQSEKPFTHQTNKPF